MSVDPFDEVFGPTRGFGKLGSPERDLAHVQAALKHWASAPERALSVIEHADLVEVSARISTEGHSSRHAFTYEWWPRFGRPAGRWLLDLGRRGEAQLIAGWDYITEQQQREGSDADG